jgi:hypothetical protein
MGRTLLKQAKEVPNEKRDHEQVIVREERVY